MRPIGFTEGKDILLAANISYLRTFRVGDVVVVQHRDHIGDIIDVFRIPYSKIAGISGTIGQFAVRAEKEGDEASGDKLFHLEGDVYLSIYLRGGWVVLNHFHAKPNRPFDTIRLSPLDASELDAKLTDLKDAITTGLQSGDIDSSEH